MPVDMKNQKKPSMYKIMNARIREDWGTVKNFAKQNGFNNNTVKVVLQGAGKSRFITDRLIELGYLGHADELVAHTKKQKG